MSGEWNNPVGAAIAATGRKKTSQILDRLDALEAKLQSNNRMIEQLQRSDALEAKIQSNNRMIEQLQRLAVRADVDAERIIERLDKLNETLESIDRRLSQRWV